MEESQKQKKSLASFFLAGFVLIVVGGIVSAIVYFGPKPSSPQAIKGIDTFAPSKSDDQLAINPTEPLLIQENAKIEKKTTWNTYSNNILGIEFKYSPEFTYTENVTGGAKDVVDFVAGDRQFKIERAVAGSEQDGPFKLNSTPKEINGITWQMVAVDKNSAVPPSYFINRSGYTYTITYSPNLENDMKEILATFKFNN